MLTKSNHKCPLGELLCTFCNSIIPVFNFSFSLILNHNLKHSPVNHIGLIPFSLNNIDDRIPIDYYSHSKYNLHYFGELGLGIAKTVI